MLSTRRTRRIAGASVAVALLGAPLFLSPAAAASWATDAFRGQVEVVPATDADATPDLLDGVVFEDLNRNSQRDAGEPGIEGVRVSNGVDVVVTDAEGRYEVSVGENTTVFMSQPAGYRVPVDADNIPQFAYMHIPGGSPELKYGGLAPSGPTPDAVNFPLVADETTANAEQTFVVATDTQVTDSTEVEWARAGTYTDLAAREDYSSAGVLLTGDNANDDLSIYPEFRTLTAMLNGPAWMIPGNHDMDFDAPSRDHAYDTFRAEFNLPSYYSFDAGDMHVIQLETIDYPRADSDSYMNVLNAEQLAWLEADVAATPKDKAILLTGHAPIATLVDGYTDQHTLSNHADLVRILEGREVLNVGGHVHALEVFRKGDLLAEWQEFFGLEALPFTTIDAGAVSGNWYSGRVTEAGYPMAIMADGTEPGVLNLAYTGTEYLESYSVRGDANGDAQMGLGLNSPAYRAYWEENYEQRGKAQPMDNPHSIPTGDLAETWLTINPILGGTGDTVEVSFDGGPAVTAERTQPFQGEAIGEGVEWSDPNYVLEQFVHGGSLSNRSSHLWRVDLPEDLAPGTHTVEATFTTIKGAVHTKSLTFDVVEGDGTPGGDDGDDTGTSGDIPVTAEIPSLGGDGNGGGDDGDGAGEPGALALSVADGGLALGDARNAGDRLRLSGTLPHVTVTDSRSGAAGWAVTGQSTDLVRGGDDDSAGAKVAASHLGWTPFRVSGNATAGQIVAPALSGGSGLAAPATLATSSGGVDSSVLSADVELETPVDTAAGSYSGGLSLSLFPQD